MCHELCRSSLGWLLLPLACWWCTGASVWYGNWLYWCYPIDRPTELEWNATTAPAASIDVHWSRDGGCAALGSLAATLATSLLGWRNRYRYRHGGSSRTDDATRSESYDLHFAPESCRHPPRRRFRRWLLAVGASGHTRGEYAVDSTPSLAGPTTPRPQQSEGVVSRRRRQRIRDGRTVFGVTITAYEGAGVRGSPLVVHRLGRQHCHSAAIVLHCTGPAPVHDHRMTDGAAPLRPVGDGSRQHWSPGGRTAAHL